MLTGIWKQVYNSDGKVSDIYFYRQMSADELHTKVDSPCSGFMFFCIGVDVPLD